MAKPVERQGYHFYACERCDFAYKGAADADECAAFDLAHGLRSADITGRSIAPPQRHYQAVMKFLEEETKAKAAAAKAAAAGGAAPTAAKPVASPAAGGATAAPTASAASAANAPGATSASTASAVSGPPKFTPEELEARKKAALEKAAAMKAAKAAEQQPKA